MDSQRLDIIHLIEPGSGGTMRHVLDLARAQADISHNVTIIYSPLRLENMYAEQLRQLPNVNLYTLPMGRAGPRPIDIKNLFELVKILRAEKPHILHAHSTKAGLLARLARIFIPICVIYTSHAMMSMNPDIPRWQKNIYAIYEKIMSCLTNRVIVLSQHEYDHARDLGIPAAKIMSARNGTMRLPLSDRAIMRAAQSIQEHQHLIGFVGRMVPQKNPELAISAFAKAHNELPDSVLYMIGDGELQSVCKALAKTLGIDAHIRWLGSVDALPHYAALDLLLMTSRYEGMPYSFLEALQAGVPIVTTDIGGSESCVIPGQTGEVAPADADALAYEIVKILNNKSLHSAMQLAAMEHAKHFGIAQMLESVMVVYNHALNSKLAK